ncbi:hypothetical protein OUZ56_027419 [Daphnia magna]|uniref:Uncharacterized protein n=1 Tax=Daphnia magna TaxID=35525 RepID=A0ABQ9ZQL9_9CRUS|nr:hypothetical protein OUZ56_027419 [Daphnia magna]
MMSWLIIDSSLQDSVQGAAASSPLIFCALQLHHVMALEANGCRYHVTKTTFFVRLQLSF